MVLPPPMQSSLPAGWLAFTGRASNPLDHNKRFQITHPPFLDLSWRYRDELPPPHPSSPKPLQRQPTLGVVEGELCSEPSDLLPSCFRHPFRPLPSMVF